ncbi:MAG: restriction endonuclease subunit S [Tissierellia bacterium]|nr:restriction endonuclease subunit S [Tissierellia bacterium]
MKDSGVQWIGEIPEDWEVIPTKYVFSNKKIIVGIEEDKYERLALTLNGVVKRSKTDSEGLQPIKFSTYQILRENELVFKLIDLQNISTSRVGLSPFTGIVSPAYIVLSINDRKVDNEKFYYYWFMSMYYRQIFNQLGDDGVRSNINSTQLLNIPIPKTDIFTQNRIVQFIDDKSKKISGIQNIINQEIQSLEDYKKAIITEAVTKGLDKKAPMKDSGIEWIGEIPKHWEKGKVKHICQTIGSGATPTSSDYSFYNNGSINWIQSGDLYKKNKVRDTEKYITEKAIKAHPALKIYKNPFLVIAMYGGGSVGNVAVSLIDAATNQACCVIKTNNDSDLMYLYYWLTFAKEDLLNKSEGARQPNISQDKIKNQIIFTPPLKEQEEIVSYLDQKTATIDHIISIKRQQLQVLEDYKKSLIYEYVTGKKEVAHG